MSKKNLALGLVFAAFAGGCASAGGGPQGTANRPNPSFHACSSVRYVDESRNCLESITYEDQALVSKLSLKRGVFGVDTANVEANENFERVVDETNSIECQAMKTARALWLNVLPPGHMRPINGEVAYAMSNYFNAAERCHTNVSNRAIHVVETQEAGKQFRQRAQVDARLARYYQKFM